MKLKYNPYYIELFIQKDFFKENIFSFINLYKSNKYYSLCMFPYPSGKLHIGHIRNYTIGDIVAGYARLKGFNVLNTIGWDSFGIPAENAAYKNNVLPDVWTYKNIFNMRQQLKRLGFSFDWNKEITTSNPNYYKWEQLFFIKLYKSGLVYKKYGIVNWDPIEKTVLANEQVIDGKGWRSNAVIKRIKIQQWYIKISEYANLLLDDINLLYGWPAKVKEMQKNWIGKIYKIKINFYIEEINDCLSIFFDNIFLLYFLKEIILFSECDISKKLTSYKFIYAFNPLSNTKIKITISNNNEALDSLDYDLKFFDQDYYILLNKLIIRRVSKINLKNIFIKFLLFKKNLKKVESFKLQDWCISRQRYWGTPIPIIYCKSCGMMCEHEQKLPVVLPKININQYIDGALLKIKDFYFTNCYLCGEKAHRELDTFDTFFESSWYYLKYLCKDIFFPNIINKWLPVDYYIGGIEHATMHLIYARFFYKVMRDFSIVNNFEPFNNLLTQGMVLMGGSKMSKSKGNIADQELLIKNYGADTLRMFIIFSAPPEHSFEWNDNGIKGCKKFIDRIWEYAYIFNNIVNEQNLNTFSSIEIDIIKKYNLLIDKIYNVLFKTFTYNVIISYLMQMLRLVKNYFNNLLYFFLYKNIYTSILIFLSPIIPHVTMFIWKYIFNNNTNIFFQKLPEKIFIKNNNTSFDLMVFINNKFKVNITINDNKFLDNNYTVILNNEKVKRFILEKKVKRVIFKNNKIINIIV